MVFPEAPRVLYERNPLETVVCQLRFPQILRIEADEPVAFQERIRSEYPILTTRAQLDLTAGLPAEFAKLVGENLPLPLRQGRAYDFASADEKWKATLAGTFVALTAARGAYVRWEDFKSRLIPLVNAVVEMYGPAFFSRSGLRYQNVIRRSVLGLDGVPWRELIQPHVAGALGGSIPEAAIERITAAAQFHVDDGAKVVVRHGLGQTEASGEIGYVLDADFFTENRTEVTHAIERLESFNREARRLLHWCVTGRLHDAMGPRPI
jgi:uncharacterized protein (TIGR04255 family)